MADLSYNEERFTDLINRLDSNIRKIESELNTFNENYEKIKSNWSGTEFEKVNTKLLEIKETLEVALEDNRKQKQYLEQKNNDFSSQISGL